MARNYQTNLIVGGDARRGMQAMRQVRGEMGRTSRTTRNLDRRFHAFSRTSAALRRTMIGLGTALTASLSVGAAVRGLQQLTSEATNLDKVSQTVSLTVGELQELRFAFEQAAGVTANTVDMAMQRFARRVGEAANDTGELNTIVKELNVELRNADGTLRSQTELLGVFADEIANAESSQEALRIAFKLFDSEGAKLVALLRQGSDAVEDLRGQFRDTGATMSDELVVSAALLTDQVHVLRLQAKGFGNDILEELLPALNALAEQFIVVREEGDALEEAAGTISTGFVSLVAAGRMLWGVFEAVGTAVIGVTQTIVGSFRQIAAPIEGLVVTLARVQQALLAGDFEGAATAVRGLGTEFAEAAEKGRQMTDQGLARFGEIPGIFSDAQDWIDRYLVAWLEAQNFAREAADNMGESLGGIGDAGGEAAEKFETSLDKLAATMAGPVAQAQLKYEQQLDAAKKLLDAGKISQEQFNRAQALYRKELDKSIDRTDEYTTQLEDMEAALAGPLAEATLEYSRQIQEYLQALEDGSINQELFNKLLEAARREFDRSKDPIRQAAQSFADLESELELAAAKAGMTTEEVEHLERELFILEKTTALVTAAQEAGVEVTDEMIAAYREMAGAAFDASNAQDDFGRTLAQSLATAISASQGQSLGESLGASLRAYGTEEIQEGIQDALTAAMDAIGVDAEKQGSALAVASLAIGQAVGGQMGAAIGTALGAAIGSVIPGIGTALGAAIGGLIGGLFDGGSVPKFQVRGPDADRAISEGTDFVRGTALVEELQFAFRELNAEVQREVEQAFLGFDRAMAGIIRDAGQLEEIEEALREFAVSSRSDGEDLETLLQMRFDAIMGTFDEAIQAVVEQGLTLEEQVQRLAEVLGIERELDFGRGLGLDGLEETLGAITDLAIPGEMLGETFVRIRDAVADLDTALAMTGATIGQTRLETLEFAAGLTEAFGNTERLASVWDTIFETFYSEGERAAAEAGQARNVAEALLDQLGIELTDELATESGFRELLDELMPTLDPEDLAILLEAGEAIARLIDAEDRLADARGDSLSELDQFMAGIEDSILEIMSPNRLGLQQLREAQDEQMEQAAALGASEAQLMRVRELHALQNLQFTAALQESINSLAQSLAESLHGTQDAGQQFQDLGNTAANSANQIRDAFIQALESIEDWIAGSQLGQFSPLTPGEQLNEAQAQFDAALAAALGGDVDAMGDLPGLADALLGQASSFFGTSTSDFQAIWDAVQAAMGQVSELEPPPEQTVEQQIASSTQSTADNTWEQVQQAMQLIDEIGLLAGLTGELPSDIAADLEEQFGLSMADLITAIGGEMPDLDGQAIEDYFNDLVIEAGDQATELADLAITSSDQLDATERIRDLAEDQLSASHEIRDILQTIASGEELEQFAEGGPVTSTGPIGAHAGEYVVPQGGTLVSASTTPPPWARQLVAEVRVGNRDRREGNVDRRVGIRTTRDGQQALVSEQSRVRRELARNRLHSGASRRKPALT